VVSSASGDISPSKVASEQREGVDQEEAKVIDDEAQEELEAEEVQRGSRKMTKLNDPKEPSAEERRIHEMTHLPFRSWCRHCVRGRGKEAAHRTQPKGGGYLHELHFD
jgi:hypothetical protein